MFQPSPTPHQGGTQEGYAICQLVLLLLLLMIPRNILTWTCDTIRIPADHSYPSYAERWRGEHGIPLLLHHDLMDLHPHRMQSMSQTRHFLLHSARIESRFDRCNVTFLSPFVQAGQSSGKASHRSSKRRNGRIEVGPVQIVFHHG